MSWSSTPITIEAIAQATGEQQDSITAVLEET
jgi:hypothetical protein